MPTYIRLIKVNDAQRLVDDPGWGPGEAGKILAQFGGKIINVWATMGAYDFVGIVEAPDNESMTAASAKIGALLGIETVTMPAMPFEDFAKQIRA